MESVMIRTANPEALKATLDDLVGGPHRVLLDTVQPEGDRYLVEVETPNSGFIIFACQNQGYGEVVV